MDNRGVNTLNLFAYCGNNPVNNTDPDGHLFIGALVGGVIGGLVGGLGALVSGKSVTTGIITGAIAGAAIGAVGDAVVTGGLSVVAGVALTGLISGVANFTNQVANNYIQTSNNKKNSSSKKTVTPKNDDKIKQTAEQIADSIAHVDYVDVAKSTVISMAFTPVAYGTGNLVNSAFAGSQPSAFHLTGEIIGSTFMEINNSLIQFIIELF